MPETPRLARVSGQWCFSLGAPGHPANGKIFQKNRPNLSFCTVTGRRICCYLADFDFDVGKVNMRYVLAIFLWAACSWAGAAVQPIVPNTAVEEQVSNGTEKIYSFTLKQNEGIVFNFTATLNSGTVSYYLYDNEQLRSYSYIKNGSISTSSNSTLDFKAASTATYYLQVKSSGNGSYKMEAYRAWFNEGVSDAERTFHGSAFSAWNLGNGTYPAQAGAKNWYRLTASAGKKIQIDVTPNLNSGSFTASLFDGLPDSNGNWTTVGSVSSLCCTSINGVTRTLTFTPATSGLFYLQTNQSGGGTLTLAASGVEVGTYIPPSTTTPSATTCPTVAEGVPATYSSGVLKIPEVQVSDGLGGTLKYAVDLELVPLSNPSAFTIRKATPK